jgi:hypothetical protein
MKEFDARQIPVLGAGLLLGIVADLLLRTTPWGINLPLCIIAFIILAVILEARCGFGLPLRITWLAPAVCFFACAFAWRDSGTLKIANGCALCCIMSLAMLRNRSGNPALGRVTEYSFGLIREWLAAPFSYIKTSFSAMAWLRTLERRCNGTILAVLRGVAMAVPLLLIFGVLFTRADASFEYLVYRLFDFDIPEFTRMVIWLPVFTVIGGGALLRLLSEPEMAEGNNKKSGYSLGLIETTIVLGLLNILFISFIAVQFAYFFGGTATLAVIPDLSMANYARRGFFELVTVSLLLLPLLLGIHWLSDNDVERRQPLVTILSTLLVLMLFAVMASAMHRMYLYLATFGLTELRLYTSAFMAWLALVFAWFMKTVLFGRREKFAFGALVTGFMVVALLDFINPDALIVRANMARHSENRPVDIQYLLSLSADAVPSLAAALPLLDETAYYTATSWMNLKLNEIDSRDWRSWNWSAQGLRHSVRTSAVRP